MAVITEDERLPLWQRRAYVLLACVCIGLLGGVIYGWPSMRALLRRDGVLEPAECEGLPEGEQCVPQELAFSLIFTVGIWANQGGRLFTGIILDKVGPRWTASASALAFCAGLLLFALFDSAAGMALGALLIGAGGSGVQLSLQCSSALFPRNRSLVMSSFSGACQVGSAVFLLFDVLHGEAGAGRVGLLLGYVGVGLAVAAVLACAWPSQPFGLPAIPQAAKGSKAAVEVEGSPGSLPLELRSFREQALSAEYLLFLLFFAVNALSLNFTTSTIGTQFDLMARDGAGSSEAATRVFNLCFSLSFLFTPIMGSLIDRLGFPPVLVAVNTLCVAVPAGLLVPDLRAQYAASICYSLGRVGLFASFCSFNGAIFGFRHYGKLAGGGLMVGACFSLLQYPLLDLSLGYFEEDFSFVNSTFIALSALQYLLLGKLACRLKAQCPAAKGEEAPQLEAPGCGKAPQGRISGLESQPATLIGPPTKAHSSDLADITFSILPTVTPQAKVALGNKQMDEELAEGTPKPEEPQQVDVEAASGIAGAFGGGATRGVRTFWPPCACA